MWQKAESWGPWLTLLFVCTYLGCSAKVPSPSSSDRENAPRAGGEPKATAVEPSSPKAVEPKQPASLPSSPFRFQDVAKEARLHFQHHSPLTEQRHTHLTYGSGVCWLDYDRDGWPDLFCCQGASFDPCAPQGAGTSPDAPSNRLFRNQRNGSFVDVTEQAGLLTTIYCMGAAAADYDNDGFPDLCVTGYGENLLYHNNGNGTFSQQVLPGGKLLGRLSSSCNWADIDGDGDLDLFIVNYALLVPDNYPLLQQTEAGRKMYFVCHPCQLQAIPDTLYRNCGGGKFVDVSVEAGIATEPAHCGLGVVAADLDGDGDVDFYVSNDSTANSLWENQGKGTFVDRGLEVGVAFNRYGAAEAGMGVEAADFDGDGRIDLFVTNFFHETNTFYRNEGNLLFNDITPAMGLGAPSKLRLGFGTCAMDFDGDTFLDLLIANGHVHDRLQEIGRDEPFAQLPLLFHNEHGRRFSEVSAGSGPYFTETHVGRGAAAADYDRDGDIDVAINHLNGPLALLRNDTRPAGHWLQIELIGTRSNRGGVGAVVTVDLGQRSLVRARQAGSGYLSCNEERMTIGLGDATRVPRVSVRWPSGLRECWTDVSVNKFLQFKEGTGKKEE